MPFFTKSVCGFIFCYVLIFGVLLYFSKSAFHFIKIVKEICETILNLDLKILLFLQLFLIFYLHFSENAIPKMFKNEVKRFINKIAKPSSQNVRKFFC